MNIIITGKKNSGKSTIVKRLIKDFKFFTRGYLTLPIFDDNIICGYKIISLPYNNIEKEIIRIDKLGNNISFPEVFSDFGSECVFNAIKYDSDFIVFDEIGRIEKDIDKFINLIEKAFDINKNVIAVLKKENIQFINNIKNRKDIFLWDIDEIDRDLAYIQIFNFIKKGIKF